jgi:Polysaccharide lyase
MRRSATLALLIVLSLPACSVDDAPTEAANDVTQSEGFDDYRWLDHPQTIFSFDGWTWFQQVQGGIREATSPAPPPGESSPVGQFTADPAQPDVATHKLAMIRTYDLSLSETTNSFKFYVPSSGTYNVPSEMTGYEILYEEHDASGGSPPIALFLEWPDGSHFRLALKYQTPTGGGTTLWRSGLLPRDVWHSAALYGKWETDTSGRLALSIDGTTVYSDDSIKTRNVGIHYPMFGVHLGRANVGPSRVFLDGVRVTAP